MSSAKQSFNYQRQAYKLNLNQHHGHMPSQAILTACSIAIATGIVMPLERRYKVWKASRAEVTLRRNRRGKLVPDLRLKRIEQAGVIALISFFVLGFLVLLSIANVIR